MSLVSVGMVPVTGPLHFSACYGFGLRVICGRGDFLQFDAWKFGLLVSFCLLEPGIAFRSSLVSTSIVLGRSIVFALEHFSDYNLFQNLSLDELLPWVDVQGSFEQFGPPKLVLSLGIWLLSSILLFVIFLSRLWIQVSCHVFPVLLLVLSCESYFLQNLVCLPFGALSH